MHLAPARRDVRENVVVRPSGEILVTEAEIRKPATVGVQVAHFAVEDGNGSGRVVEVPPQPFLAPSHQLLSLLPTRDVTCEPDQPQRGTVRPDLVSPVFNDPPSGPVWPDQSVLVRVR